MNWLEIIGTVTGIACVLLYARQKIACWPVGIVQVLVYAVVFWQARLYSDFGLQLIYVPIQVYGWWHWSRRGHPTEDVLGVVRIHPLEAMMWIAIGVSASAILGYLMASYTDASLPFPDAATTVVSLIAQWLIARKILESWCVWVAVDVASIGIYAAKGLILTSGLYTVFLVLAVYGYISWRKSLIQHDVAALS